MNYALVNCNVLTGDLEAIQHNLVVEVTDGKISFVGTNNSSRKLPEKTFDCAGAFILPGLIDMHVHICHSANHGPSISERYWESPVSLTINALKNLKIALHAGITTVRDLGAGLDVSLNIKNEWERGRVFGARPIVAGHMLTCIGSHGTEYGGNMAIEVSGSAELIKAIRQEVKNGVDLIKLVTSSGGTKTELTLDELTAGVNEAHWIGLKVACHAAYKRHSILNAILSGCDTLEHGCVLDQELVDLMLEKGTIYCPTLKIVQDRIPQSRSLGVDSEKHQKAIQAVAKHESGFRIAFKEGVPIIGGTDAGWRGITFDALHDELEIMCSLGMSSLEAIHSVTGQAAVALDMKGKIGNISEGAYADMLIVPENPLENLSILRNPSIVIQAGKTVIGSFDSFFDTKRTGSFQES